MVPNYENDVADIEDLLGKCFVDWKQSTKEKVEALKRREDVGGLERKRHSGEMVLWNMERWGVAPKSKVARVGMELYLRDQERIEEAWRAAKASEVEE